MHSALMRCKNSCRYAVAIWTIRTKTSRQEISVSAFSALIFGLAFGLPSTIRFLRSAISHRLIMLMRKFRAAGNVMPTPLYLRLHSRTLGLSALSS